MTTEPNDFTQLSELINSILKIKGLTQSDLAKACSINRGYISKLVNNKLPYPPSHKLLGAIAKALDLNEAYLNILAGLIPLSIKPLVLRFLMITGDRAEEIMQEAIKNAS